MGSSATDDELSVVATLLTASEPAAADEGIGDGAVLVLDDPSNLGELPPQAQRIDSTNPAKRRLPGIFTAFIVSDTL